MIRRTIALTLVLLLLAPALASAQGGAFGPLQQESPAPTATPAPVEEDDPFGDNVGRNTLYVIAGALLLAFIAVGVFISRDARRSLPRGGRDRGRLRDEGPHKHQRQAKAKARARTKAQRAARRRNR